LLSLISIPGAREQGRIGYELQRRQSAGRAGRAGSIHTSFQSSTKTSIALCCVSRTTCIKPTLAFCSINSSAHFATGQFNYRCVWASDYNLRGPDPVFSCFDVVSLAGAMRLRCTSKPALMAGNNVRDACGRGGAAATHFHCQLL
jgi:hypothetical protein